MQHIPDNINDLRQRIESAARRLRDLNDMLLGPQPREPEGQRIPETTLSMRPPLVICISNAVTETHRNLEELFHQVERLESVFESGPSKGAAPGYAATERKVTL